MKRLNPKITKGIYPGGAPFWLVSCTVCGKRYRKKHDSEEAAHKDRAKLVRQDTGGLDVQKYGEAERAMYELKNSSNEDAKAKDIVFAVRWFCEHFVDERKVKPLRLYFEEFIGIKRAQGRREATVSELQRILGRFVKDFEMANVANIRFRELEAWIDANSNGPRSRQRVFHMVKHFFGYLSAMSENTPNHAPVLPKSPFEGRGVVYQDDEADEHTNVVIYTAGECEALIREAQRFNAQRMFVWLIFTGMRPFEAVRFWSEERWGWNLISPDLRFVTVPKAVSKTRRSRMIEVSPTLRRWLAAYRDFPSLMTGNWRDKYRWVRKGVLPKEKLTGDVARHTLISMMIKDGKGWAEIELQMGNKKDVQMRHYASLIVSESEVRDFYALTPDKFDLDMAESERRKMARENRKRAILINRLRHPQFKDADRVPAA